MAGIICDETVSDEGICDDDDFVFASGDDCGKGASNKDAKEDVGQKDKNSVNVSSDSTDSSKSHLFELLATSDYIQDRKYCAQTIIEQLHLAESKEDLISAISTVCKLGEDEELSVRAELIIHLPYIASFCKEHPEDLSTVLRQQVVPCTIKLLTEEQIMLRRVGHLSLKVFLEKNILDNSQLIDWICPLISELVTIGTSEELRSEDVSGMCRIIPFVGKDITEKFFLSPFISLCCDASSNIRKVCAVNFGTLCQVIERETTESTLLPAFLNLCNDEVWTVRKECADVFVKVARAVTFKSRKEILPHIFINLLDDESRFVKLAAYESLGDFIATFCDPSKLYLDNESTSMDESTNYQQDSINVQKNNEIVKKKNLSVSRSNQLNLNFNTNLNLEQNNLVNLNLEISDKNTYLENECKLNSLSGNNIQETVICDKLNDRLNDTRFMASNKKQCRLKSSFGRNEGLSRSLNIDVELTNAENLLNSQTKSTDNLYLQDNKLLNIGVYSDNFNNFQFWRTPLPEVELDLDIEPIKFANIQYVDNNSCTPAIFSGSPSKMPEITNTNSRNCHNTFEEIGDVACSKIISETSKFIIGNDESQENTTKLFNSVKSEKKKMTVYDQDIVPPVLLERFLHGVNEGENATIFAHGFRTVAFTLGAKYWPCIRSVCFVLAGDLEYTVRRIITSYLHDLASFLYYDIIIEDLLPIFLKMSKDIDCVRIKVLENLSSFLQYLMPEERRKFLPFIEGILTIENENNWRFCYTVAEQLVPCVTLFDLSEVKSYFLPVCLTLMNDKACAVRKSTIKLLAVIIKAFLEDSFTNYEEEVFSLIDNYITMYKQEKKWHQRQMYVYICQELACQKSLPSDLYVEKIVPGLFSLATDPVPNVRLAVARCLSLTLLPLGYLPNIQKCHYQLLLQVMYSLQSDVDRDVRHFAHLSAGAFNVLPQKKLSPI